MNIIGQLINAAKLVYVYVKSNFLPACTDRRRGAVITAEILVSCGCGQGPASILKSISRLLFMSMVIYRLWDGYSAHARVS